LLLGYRKSLCQFNSFSNANCQIFRLAGAGVAGVAVTAEMLAAAGSSSRDDDAPQSCTCDGITGCGDFCKIRDRDEDGFIEELPNPFTYAGGESWTSPGGITYTCPSDFVHCEVPGGGNDCNDDDALVNPDAQEICNGDDDNCDDNIDGDAVLDVNVECISGQLVCHCLTAEFDSCGKFCENRDQDTDGCFNADLSGTYSGGDILPGLIDNCPAEPTPCQIRCPSQLSIGGVLQPVASCIIPECDANGGICDVDDADVGVC
jgi:hypothetical protein